MCQQQFPLLYDQLEVNTKAWKRRGGIQKVHLDEAEKVCRLSCVRLIIKNGVIYLKRVAHPMQTRVQEVLSLFKTAIDAAPWEDLQAFEGIEMVFNAFDLEEDNPTKAAWVIAKKETDAPGQYLLPDFGFGTWPEAGIGSYAHFRRLAEEVNRNMTWNDKGNRAFFRGDPYVAEDANPAHANPVRINMMEEIHKPGAEVWADVARTSFGPPDPNGQISHFVPIEEHCRHKYLLHSEGVSYSGRGKYVLGCAAAVITHQLRWTQHFHPALNSDFKSTDQNSESEGCYFHAVFVDARDSAVIVSPGVNFEQLARLMLDLQDRDHTMASAGRFSTSGQSPGFKVAQNANRTLVNRYLTPASVSCYVRGALRSYASILDRASFNDGRGPQVTPGGGVTQHSGTKSPEELKQSLRGDVDLASWAAIGHPEYPPA